MWKYGRHPICDGWDIGEEKRKKEDRNHRTKIISASAIRRAAIKTFVL